MTRKQRLRADRLRVRRWWRDVNLCPKAMRERRWVSRGYMSRAIETMCERHPLMEWNQDPSRRLFPAPRLELMKYYRETVSEPVLVIEDNGDPRLIGQAKMVQGGTAVVRGNPGPFLRYVGCDWAKSVSRTGRVIFQKRRTDADDAMRYALMAAKLACPPVTFKAVEWNGKD
jgi:hypothetical protein